MSVFVDTSCWYAAADSGDASNTKAKSILKRSEPRLTTDYVLLETWRLLHHRIGWAAAESFWEGIRGGVAELEIVGPADLEAAWNIGRVYADQEFSLTDRTSFAVMQRLGIEQAAAFDRDFAIYRFGKNRKQSFEVLM